MQLELPIIRNDEICSREETVKFTTTLQYEKTFGDDTEEVKPWILLTVWCHYCRFKKDACRMVCVFQIVDFELEWRRYEDGSG